MYRKKPQGWLKHIDFILFDVLSLHLAFLFAYMIRHGLVSPYIDDTYRELAIVLTLIDVAVLIYNSSMKNVLKRGLYKEFAMTMKHVFFVVVVLTFCLFSVKRGESFSRIFIYIFIGLYTLTSYLIRLAWKKHLLARKEVLNKTALYLITTKEHLETKIQEIKANTNGYYQLVGTCVVDQNMKGQEVNGVVVSADSTDVFEFLRTEWVDEVYLSLPKDTDYAEELTEKLVSMGMVVHVEMQPFLDGSDSRQIMEKMAGHTVITVGLNFATSRQMLFKRVMDLGFGLVGCLCTVIATVILGPWIFLQSPGPIFFAQTRVGRNGKLFKMYKFRSMYLDAEERKAELMKQNKMESNLMFKLDYDPRIIGCKRLPDGTIKKGIGNFIRDWSIDELPQFFNVLKGDMSVCGVRPPLPQEVEQYELHHKGRLGFKPGITGLWQVSGRSDITNFDEVVKLDMQYITEWSLGLDIKIILKTISAVLGKKGAV